MKEALKTEIHKFEDAAGDPITKGDFTGVFGRAFQTAFTPKTVKAAFRTMGVFPFNPDVITESQMKPSKATSTQASFPLPQPSPVHAVMAAFRSYKPTQAEVNPENFQPVAGMSASTHLLTTQSPHKRA